MFEADVADAVQRMRFNGFVRGINPKTGKNEDVFVITSCCKKSTFLELELSKVDPVECLLSICEKPSPMPHLLKPVALPEAIGIHGDNVTHGTSSLAEKESLRPPSGESSRPIKTSRSSSTFSSNPLTKHALSLVPLDSLPSAPSESSRTKNSVGSAEILPGESPKAQALAKEKGDYWEHLLTEELIRSKLTALRSEHAPVSLGLEKSSRNYAFDRTNFADYVLAAAEQVGSELTHITTCSNQDIHASWGAPGVPGDVGQIVSVVEKLVGYVRAVQRIESDVLSTTPPDVFVPVRNSFEGLTVSLIDELMHLPDELRRIVDQAQRGTLRGTVRLDMEIKLHSFFTNLHSSLSAAGVALRP
jgi:hypothetical protein